MMEHHPEYAKALSKEFVVSYKYPILDRVWLGESLHPVLAHQLVFDALEIKNTKKSDNPNLFFRCFARKKDGTPFEHEGDAEFMGTTLKSATENLLRLGIERPLFSTGIFQVSQGQPDVSNLIRLESNVIDIYSFVMVYDANLRGQIVPPEKLTKLNRFIDDQVNKGVLSMIQKEDELKHLYANLIKTEFMNGLQHHMTHGDYSLYLKKHLAKILIFEWI